MLKTMEKYYTPTIEEFHVGFEFEFSGVDSNWRKQPFSKQKVLKDESEYFGLYTLSWIEKICKDPEFAGLVRVKYLDREDIESLGWKFEGGQMIKDGASMWENGIHQLRFWNNTTHVEISFNRLYKKFDGEIFNKSELRFIMKRLGI